MNRKNRPSLNVQVIGGKNRLIFDVDVRAPGRMHDSRVWRYSHAKQYVEQRHPRFLLAGDAFQSPGIFLIASICTIIKKETHNQTPYMQLQKSLREGFIKQLI